MEFQKSSNLHFPLFIIIKIFKKKPLNQHLKKSLDENTRKREFEPLEKINDNCPKYVLSLDNWDYSQNGITHLNIIEFLKGDFV